MRTALAVIATAAVLIIAATLLRPERRPPLDATEQPALDPAEQPALGPAQEAALPPTDTGRVAVGDVAPDFTLESRDGRRVTLSGFRGEKTVVLVFYRGHW